MDNILKIRKRLENYSLDELGETLWKFVASEDNYIRDMTKGVVEVYNTIQTPEELRVAEKLLIAFAGEDMDNLLDWVDKLSKKD